MNIKTTTAHARERCAVAVFYGGVSDRKQNELFVI